MISSQTAIQNAKLLCKHGEYAGAEELLKQALHINENTALVIHWLQYCLEAQGQYDEAASLHEDFRARSLEQTLRENAPFYTDYEIQTGMIAVFDENDERLAAFKTSQEAEGFIKKQMGL